MIKLDVDLIQEAFSEKAFEKYKEMHPENVFLIGAIFDMVFEANKYRIFFLGVDLTQNTIMNGVESESPITDEIKGIAKQICVDYLEKVNDKIRDMHGKMESEK